MVSTMRGSAVSNVHVVCVQDVSQELWPAAEVNVGHHLHKLRLEGRAGGFITYSSM